MKIAAWNNIHHGLKLRGGRTQASAPVSSSIAVVVQFPDGLRWRSLDATFSLSEKVSSIQQAIASALSVPMKRVVLTWGKKILNPTDSLSSVFCHGGVVTSPIMATLRDYDPTKVTLRDNDTVKVKRFLETISVLKQILQNEEETHNHVDQIVRHLDLNLDREIILTCYMAAIESSDILDKKVEFLTYKLLEMGLYKGVTEGVRKTEQHRPSVQGRNGLSSAVPGGTNEVECPVCLDDVPAVRTLQLRCRHSACFGCCADYIRKSPPTPKLKCFMPQCTHKLSPQEIILMLGQGVSVVGRADPMCQEIDERQRDYCLSKDPKKTASCPQCGLLVFRHERGGIEKATCQRCNFDFCTNCSSIYHYRTTCLMWQQTRRDWNEWKQSGRSHYWRDNKERLKRAQKAAKADEKRIRQVMEEERQDEEYKRLKCRHCPHCDRVVERIEGCGVMRCGYDTDNGLNRQNGCGEKFDWNKAKPYQPVKIGQNIKKERLDARAKKFHHVGVRCEGCGSTDVRGLLFECVNCPSYILCENCEHDYTDQHDSGHVFAIRRS